MGLKMNPGLDPVLTNWNQIQQFLPNNVGPYPTLVGTLGTACVDEGKAYQITNLLKNPWIYQCCGEIQKIRISYQIITFDIFWIS